jgi:hypothetical protein
MTWAIATGIAIGAIVGGGSAALQKKDILQGALIGGATGAVTGGIGSLGTSAATTGVTTAGEAALTSGATDIAGSSIMNAAPNAGLGALGSPISNAGNVMVNSTGSVMQPASLLNYGAVNAASPLTTPGISGMANTALTPGASAGAGANPLFADPMKYFGDNKMSIGLAGLTGGMARPADQQNSGQDDVTYHPYTYSSSLNSGYTGAGTPYLNQSYNKLPTYTAANGGIMSLAEGGDTVPVDSNSPATPVKKQPTIADYLAATRNATANAQKIEVPPMQANNVAVPNMQAQYIAPQQQYTRPIQQVPQAVTDYNNTLMQRAQNEYVDSPQLGAFSSHFNDPVPKPQNASITDQMFQKYLGRDADPTGYAANKNASPEQIAYGIQTSPEYMKANPNAPAPVAPVAGPVNYAFNPATGGYTTSYAPPPPDATNIGIAGLQAPQQPQLVGYNADQGGGGGFAVGGSIGSYYPEPDDGQRFQNPMMGAHQSVSMGPSYPMQGIKSGYADGGSIYNLGGYSDGGRLLKGPGDGVSDDIPAEIGGRQPARLADGEFVVPARIVSELGNGSTDAGAKQLYAMMDRVQANRRKTIGSGNVAVNSRSSKYLPK